MKYLFMIVCSLLLIGCTGGEKPLERPEKVICYPFGHGPLSPTEENSSGIGNVDNPADPLYNRGIRPSVNE